MSGALVAFLDRDGTLIEEPGDFQVDALEKIRLVEGVIPALLALARSGYRFVMVTNQDGLGGEGYPEAAFRRVQDFVEGLFASQGIRFDEVLVCPHFEHEACDCRKPRTGLLTRYLAATHLDTARSVVVGDRETDLTLARNLGLAGYRLGADGGWPRIAHAILAARRRARVRRATRETDIVVEVDLAASGPVEITTGIGYLDHMLEQVARHGGFALTLACRGDLEVDEHHTVEDVALALGQGLKEAIGPKQGIGRYGFVLPMDEARALVALDLSGRAWCRFEGELPRAFVGGLPTEMVPHFFRSLADSLGAAVHVQLTGDNCHHMVEAAFKGLGRCLRQALAVEGAELPTTKGLL